MPPVVPLEVRESHAGAPEAAQVTPSSASFSALISTIDRVDRDLQARDVDLLHDREHVLADPLGRV